MANSEMLPGASPKRPCRAFWGRRATAIVPHPSATRGALSTVEETLIAGEEGANGSRKGRRC